MGAEKSGTRAARKFRNVMLEKNVTSKLDEIQKDGLTKVYYTANETRTPLNKMEYDWSCLEIQGRGSVYDN